jgi:hypothetical protein
MRANSFHSEKPRGFSLFDFSPRGQMSTEYDDKGKFFTEVISKVPVFSTIQTTTHRMRGEIHVRRDQRVKDELNREENFVAITNVSVYADDGSVAFQAPFLAIQRSQIVWVIPDPVSGEERDY